ncbi:MAG: hypothetical protein ACFFBD_23370 [Candidatus Hodarchaeota archaeon]
MNFFTGKIEAWWLTTILPLIIGIIIFPAAYFSLFSWLGPLCGPWLYPVLLYIYILIANPLQWWLVGTLWIITGISAGLIAGTVKRSILIFFIALITNLILFGISILFLLLALQQNLAYSELVDIIPQLIVIMPPGLSSQFFTMPVLGEILSPIIEAANATLSSGLSLDPSVIVNAIEKVLLGLVLGVILNMGLLLGTLLIGGYLRQFTPFPVDESIELDFRIDY